MTVFITRCDSTLKDCISGHIFSAKMKRTSDLPFFMGSTRASTLSNSPVLQVIMASVWRQQVPHGTPKTCKIYAMTAVH